MEWTRGCWLTLKKMKLLLRQTANEQLLVCIFQGKISRSSFTPRGGVHRGSHFSSTNKSCVRESLVKVVSCFITWANGRLVGCFQLAGCRGGLGSVCSLSSQTPVVCACAPTAGQLGLEEGC